MTMNTDDLRDRTTGKFRAALRGRVGKAKFESWFSDLGVEDYSEECVTLSTGSEIKKEMMDNRWLAMMKETWCAEIGPTKRMRLTVHQKLSAHAAKIDAQEGQRAKLNGRAASFGEGLFGASDGSKFNAGIVPAKHSAKDKTRKSINFKDIATPLDGRKTFEGFAVHNSNRVAWIAAQQVFDKHAQPELIYLHGPSGVGKTHLLHAIGRRWRREGDLGPSAYITYSNFISACVNAVWSNSVHALHQNLLQNDLLEIDDIHLLDTKSRTQEELLNAVDAFLARGKQVVIAGELPPSKLPEAGISQRLADRLAAGHCVAITPGDENLRLEVLKKHLEQKTAQCTVSPESLEFIARNFSQSMRETIGGLNQILLMYGNDDVVVGVDETRATLKTRLEDRRRVVTMDDVIVAGAEAFGITIEEVICRAQPQRLVRARHAIVYCAREVLKESFPRISKALRRDHTTAMSSYRRAQALLERDKAFQKGVARIREALGG